MDEAALVSKLLTFIENKDAVEADFDQMALSIFVYQFEHNLPFKKFCLARGKTPKTVRHWADIPAVPISAFKTLDLTCSSPTSAEATFMTSGTTQGGKRGKSYHPTLAVYNASMRQNFLKRFMGNREKLKIGILFPTPVAMPNSSLAHYLELAKQYFGSEGSSHFVGSNGIDYERLFRSLEDAEENGVSYGLLGASFSFVHVLDEMERQGRRFHLPPGSRLLDTGGFKGQSRELELDTFYDALQNAFGVSRANCINMYGMTELSTQFYDNGNAVCPSVKSGPHWIKTRVVDPLTGSSLPKGTTGVLAHTDLAHFNIVTTILTEDAGVEVDEGFMLHGRVSGAEAQGCSMAVDEFLISAAAN